MRQPLIVTLSVAAPEVELPSAALAAGEAAGYTTASRTPAVLVPESLSLPLNWPFVPDQGGQVQYLQVDPAAASADLAAAVAGQA